jgi:FkbM family methyltransferase
MQNIPDFVVLESVYGKFIINRHCSFQAEALVKTGRPHIQAELDTMLAIVDQLPSDSIVVDAGANAGLVCVPVARRVQAKGGQVHAFEPQRAIYYALCGTVALNSIGNLTVHNMGLGQGNTVMSVPRVDYSVDQDFGTVSLLPRNDAGHDIAVTSLDGFGLSRLDFLKIDVEGMEIDVLRGAQKLIQAHQPWCWIEYWKVGERAIIAEFRGLDYTFCKVDALNLLCVPAGRWNREKLQIHFAPVEP